MEIKHIAALVLVGLPFAAIMITLTVIIIKTMWKSLKEDF